MEQIGRLKSHMTAALIDRDGAVQVCPPAAAVEQCCSDGAQESEANRGRGRDARQVSSRLDWDMSLFRGPVSSPQGNQKHRYSQQQHGHRFDYDGEYEYPARRPGDLTPACPRVQQHGTSRYADGMRTPGFPARLAASGPLIQSDRSSGPSSPATPPDEPKSRRSALTCLSRVPAPTSQASAPQVGSQQMLGPMSMLWTFHMCRPACAICDALLNNSVCQKEQACTWVGRATSMNELLKHVTAFDRRSADHCRY